MNRNADQTRKPEIPLLPEIPVTRSTENVDPCVDAPEPTRPTFNVPGQRLSQAKCFEYMWDLRQRDEKQKKKDQCARFRTVVPFAYGGHDTEPGEFPHMGAVGWKAIVGTWLFKCGSFLVSPNFVLTAAHCSKASSLDDTIADRVPKIIRFGNKNIAHMFSDKGDKNIVEIIVHPEYVSPKQYYDIALMKLDLNVEFSKYIQPACLWSRNDISSLGNKANLTGWGVVETGSPSNELQVAEVDIIDSKQCNDLLVLRCSNKWCGIQDHQLCAGKLAGGVDACQGDSGGPLQVRIPLATSTQGTMHYVIGVTSFGVGCALPNLPGVYTRVSSFIDWIENKVWQ